MKNSTLFAFSLLLLLTACNPKAVDVAITENFPDGAVKSIRKYRIIGPDSLLLRETHYYRNGQKYMEGRYENGLRDSTWTAWLDDGRLWSKGDYQNGKEEGAKIVFHDNGVLFYEGWYTAGKRTGEWRFYDNSGQLIQTIDYGTEGKTENP